MPGEASALAGAALERVQNATVIVDFFSWCHRMQQFCLVSGLDA